MTDLGNQWFQEGLESGLALVDIVVHLTRYMKVLVFLCHPYYEKAFAIGPYSDPLSSLFPKRFANGHRSSDQMKFTQLFHIKKLT